MKGFDLPRETYIELITDRIKYFGRQETDEDFQIMDMRYAYDNEGYEIIEDIISLDREIVRMARELGEIESDSAEVHWIWNLDAIARGEFPLERIPEHIRDLVRELYYTRAG